MPIAFRLRRPVGGSTLRGGHTLRGPLEPVAPVPPVIAIEECVDLALALVSFIQAPSGFVAEEGGEALEDLVLRISTVPSGYINAVAAFIASGFSADPDTISPALEDLVRGVVDTAPSGYMNVVEILLPSGFVADPDVVGKESLDDQSREKAQAVPSGFRKDSTTNKQSLSNF